MSKLSASNPKKNLHHTAQYKDEEEFWGSEFGKGHGDPDSLVGVKWHTVQIQNETIDLNWIPF